MARSKRRFNAHYVAALQQQLREGGDVVERELLWPRLAAVLGPLDSLHVLEGGCGFGQTTRLLLQSGNLRLTAVDLSDEFLRMAAELFMEDRRVTLQQGNVTQLHFPQGEFEIFFSAFLLENLAEGDVPLMFREARRVLKKHGRMVHAMLHPLWLRIVKQPRKGWHEPLAQYGQNDRVVMDRSARSIYFRYHRPIEWYLNAAAKEGFALEQIEAIVVTENEKLPARYRARLGFPIFQIMSFNTND